MGRVRVSDRPLSEALSLTVVCRLCESRSRMSRPELDGLAKVGIRTIEVLKQSAYCEACDYSGLSSLELRFHAEWKSSEESNDFLPHNVVRLRA